jgi:hypothetical protein
MVVVTISLALVATLALVHSSFPLQVTDVQVRSNFAASFKAVQSANLAGATNSELSNLTQQLNAALKLIDNSELLDQQGRGADADALSSQAISLLGAIPTEAANLRARAEQRTAQERLLSYLLVPIIAGLVVLAYHFGGRAHQRYRVARTMSMKVRVKPNANKK